MSKNILNSSYGNYFHLNMQFIIFISILGLLIEVFIMWISFRKNRDIQGIIAILILANVLTFIFGIVSVGFFV